MPARRREKQGSLWGSGAGRRGARPTRHSGRWGGVSVSSSGEVQNATDDLRPGSPALQIMRRGDAPPDPDTPPFSGGSADGDLGDQERRLGVGHRHPLAILAAGADAEAEVAADQSDPFQYIRAVAGKGCSPYRFSHHPFLDEVAFRNLEDEISVDRVDLASPH